jgi:hypothetical protein
MKVMIKKITIEPADKSNSPQATLEGTLGNKLGSMPVTAKVLIPDDLWSALEDTFTMAVEDDIAEHTTGTITSRHLSVVEQPASA